MARIVTSLLALALTAAAQAPAPAAYRDPAQPAAAADSVSAAMPRLQRTVQSARQDLSRLRVDKWKADAQVKQQAYANVESLQRNMEGALPTLMTAAQQNPSSLNATFKLYRNLTALYDVMSNVTESAGAFGEKEDYAALAQDLNNLDGARRSLADALDTMTAQRDAELVRLQAAARPTAQGSASKSPKKTVIDDNEPPAPKSKTPKKKPATPATTAPKQPATPKG